MATKKRSRGDRAWTEEQRAKQAEYMRKLHAEKRKAKELEESFGLPSEKSSPIPNLTIGILLDRLNKLVAVGATEDTPVSILGIDSPEICPRQKFDNHGDLVVDEVVIR